MSRRHRGGLIDAGRRRMRAGERRFRPAHRLAALLLPSLLLAGPASPGTSKPRFGDPIPDRTIAPGPGPRPPGGGAGPRPFLVLDRTQADAGTVWQGAKPVYRFSVRNTGSAPLTLALKSHCGCAVAKGDRTIPPGGSGIVEAVLDTTSFRDRIDKAVELMTNDPDRPRMMLLLRATVRSVVTVHPGEVLTVPLDPTGPTRRELALRLSDGSPVALKDLRSDSPFASVVTAPAGAPGSYRAVVTILAGAPLGRTAVTLSGVTGSERQRGFKITLHCEKGILVSPLQVHLGAVTPGERLPLRRSVTLSRASAPFAVRRVRCEDPSLETRVVRQRPGRFLLDVSYRGGWSAGKIERTLIVETDDRVQPQLSIPVTALVMPSTAPGR